MFCKDGLSVLTGWQCPDPSGPERSRLALPLQIRLCWLPLWRGWQAAPMSNQ